MNKTLIVSLFALALGLGALEASAQSDDSSPAAAAPTTRERDERAGPADRMDPDAGRATQERTEAGRPVGADRMDPARTDDVDADQGKGVATGFVAAGLGLAVLGLFVRRRNRRHDYTRGGPPPGPRL